MRAVLALGSNLGDRRAILQSAVDALGRAEEVTVVGLSAVVETDPIGGPAQPDYLNAIALVETTLRPHDLLALCQRIESDHGRERSVRWGARTLDIDVVRYGDVRLADDVLEVPHPRAAERAFVLVPWLLVDADAALPGPDGAAVPVRELLARLPDADGVRPSTVPPLEVPA